MASSQHRCVFVGNIPYDATEEQLVQICEEVGPVVSFRLVIDRETGKPKGYGFCEYKDEETALSARRNLQGYEINGRQLRVDFAENDKNADRNREQGRGGPGMVANIEPQKQVGGPAIPRDYGLHQPIGLSVAMAAASLMAGALGGPQIASNSNQNFLQSGPVLGSDPLTLHLAKMSRNQLNEIMSQMKVMATQNKEKARQLLLASPQLSKALLQVEIMLGLVTPQMLQMPNIRQASGPLTQSILQGGQQGQLPAAQTLPGLPPPVPIKMQSGLIPQGKEGQHSAVLQVTSQPQIQLPQLSQSQVLPQGSLPVHSGISTFSSILSQPLGNVSIRPKIQVAVSSSLKQPAQHLLSQKPGQIGSAGVGRNSPLVGLNMTVQHPHFRHPPSQDQGFQPSSSILSGTPDNTTKDFDGRPQVTNASTWISRADTYPSLPGSFEKPGLPNDSLDPLNRPSKMVKLDDGRSASFSKEGAKTSASVSGLPQVLGTSINPIRKAEETSNIEKQAPQLQLPPEAETALLQQVLNLTPEQLSSLPPDQQQQVIQLQQMLRQST